MVEFYLLTFSRFPVGKSKRKKSFPSNSELLRCYPLHIVFHIMKYVCVSFTLTDRASTIHVGWSAGQGTISGKSTKLEREHIKTRIENDRKKKGKKNKSKYKK